LVGYLAGTLSKSHKILPCPLLSFWPLWFTVLTQFFKFQDEEELTAHDVANVLARMHIEKRYQRLLFIADTCQAFTLFDKLSTTMTPNVLALGSSLRGENAYAHHCK
jgi:glycosylphosphatidylinositol transamidase (GPIT) subunit GPI8